MFLKFWDRSMTIPFPRAAPLVPVPEPLGIRGIFFSNAYFTNALTSSSLLGITTARGVTSKGEASQEYNFIDRASIRIFPVMMPLRSSKIISCITGS